MCIYMSFMHVVEKFSYDQFMISYRIFPAEKLGIGFLVFCGVGKDLRNDSVYWTEGAGE